MGLATNVRAGFYCFVGPRSYLFGLLFRASYRRGQIVLGALTGPLFYIGAREVEKARQAEFLLDVAAIIEIWGRTLGCYDFEGFRTRAWEPSVRLKGVVRRSIKRTADFLDKYAATELPEPIGKRVAPIPAALGHVQHAWDNIRDDRVSEGRFIAAVHALVFYFKLIILGDLV